MTADGVLLIDSREHRTQSMNRRGQRWRGSIALIQTRGAPSQDAPQNQAGQGRRREKRLASKQAAERYQVSAGGNHHWSETDDQAGD